MLSDERCAYAEGAFGHAGCGKCIECERLHNAALMTMLHRIARYWREDEGITPRATRMQRAIDRIPALLAGTQTPDLAPSTRMAARSRCRLDGADAQALEGALRQSEMETHRVSDAHVEATLEITRLRAEVARLEAGRLKPETVALARRAFKFYLGKATELPPAFRGTDYNEIPVALEDMDRCYPEEV